MIRHGNIGQGYFLDRQFVEVVSDKTTPVSFVRTTGTRLAGSVEWDEGAKLTGVILSVRKVASPEDPPLREFRLGNPDGHQGHQDQHTADRQPKPGSGHGSGSGWR